MNPTEMELQAITYNRACAHTKLGDLPAACEDLKRAYVPQPSAQQRSLQLCPPAPQHRPNPPRLGLAPTHGSHAVLDASWTRESPRYTPNS
jgi:hypothetical protein